jgi:hypothetical protein
MANDNQINLEEKTLRAQKIFPRNLTARAGHQVVGNPVVTRLESGVGNCYPGLEYDHRNLDRRFFPGLIFDFVSQSDAVSPNARRAGLRLVSVESDDPELQNDIDLLAQIEENAEALGKGSWFVDEIEQHGKAILTYTEGEKGKVFLDGLAIIYNIVRGLEPDVVRIVLSNRDDKTVKPVELKGRRRKFLNSDGVINQVFQAGELTQSLCSPWQHDFRDCACNYWASNHPDIVLTEDKAGESLLPSGGSADAFKAQSPVDWLRADRNREATAEAFSSREGNRLFQMDHYEINRRWEQLAIVLEGKEISSIYRQGEIHRAEPLASPQEVADHLKYLASLEHVLILEYLYAYFSIASEDLVDEQRFPGIKDAVIFARHQLLMIAVSEMRHLRWANQILWELKHSGLIPAETPPALEVAEEIPAGKPPSKRKRALRILTTETLDDFIAVEMPSGTLDGQYASVAATLKQPLYPTSIYQLSERIIADGVEHFSRFRELKLVLRNYQAENGKLPYLIDLVPANPQTNDLAAEAMRAYERIINNLRTAYVEGDMEDAGYIIEGRQAMEALEHFAHRLASEGLGIPFFDF